MCFSIGFIHIGKNAISLWTDCISSIRLSNKARETKTKALTDLEPHLRQTQKLASTNNAVVLNDYEMKPGNLGYRRCFIKVDKHQTYFV